MICRGFKDLGSQSISASAGSLFFSGAFAAISFPQTFVGLPECNIGVISSGGLAWASQGSALPTTTATGAYYIFNPTSATLTITVMWTAIGRWFT
jgi:hypothetical protein